MSYQRDPNLRFRSKSYPLPWAWSWCTGELGNGSGSTYPEPAWQKAQIEAGERIVPSVELSSAFIKATWASKGAYAQPAFEAARDYGLPVIFVGNNIFKEFKSFPEFADNNDPAAPDDHAWVIKGGPPDVTSDDVLSLYSELSGVWSERLGYLHGSCEIVQNAISIYETPPLVILFDNNEGVFEWQAQEDLGNYDIREPSFISDFRNWYSANIGSYSGPAADAITNRYNSIMSTRYTDMRRYMRYRFQKGWWKALRELSPHWESVAYYVPYGSSAIAFVNQDSFKVWDDSNNLPYFNATVGVRLWATEGGSGGKSSESYFNNTYGPYSGRKRVWETSSAQAWNRQLQRCTFGINMPDQMCLMWEGSNYPVLDGDNTTPPDQATIWKNYATMTAWLNRSQLVGWFTGSSTQLAWASIMDYYQKIRDVCHDAAKPTLIDFWKHGEVAESLETSPDAVYDGTHFNWHTSEMWQFQHVNASAYNRYTAAAMSDPTYSISSTPADLRRYLSQLGRNVDRYRTTSEDVNTCRRLAFAIELDGKYAIFSWSTVEGTDLGNEDVWLPIGNTIHAVTCPFNSVGAWTIYDSTATPSPTTTSYDPSTETPVPWRPWKDTSTVLDTQRKAELDARKQHIADVYEHTKNSASVTPQALDAGEQARADAGKQEATDFSNYIYSQTS